jgi:hypothetical protein
MSTFVLSYPRPGFRPVGASTSNAGVAQRAYQQWLELCDHIIRAGGHILILEANGKAEAGEPSGEPSEVYSANIGAPFLAPAIGGGPLFLRARGESAGPPPEHDPICQAMARAGLKVQVAQHPWSGQAEIISLPRNRFIVTYGPNSTAESADEVKRLLPMGAHVLAIEMARGSGMTGLAHFTSKSGASLLLVERASLKSHTPEDVAKFIIPAGSSKTAATEVHILGREDVESHATQGMCVRGTVLLPPDSSTALRGQLARLGFQTVIADVSALFGPGGGGPRALCNEWPGFVLSDDSPSYGTRRDELYGRLDQYGAA